MSDLRSLAQRFAFAARRLCDALENPPDDKANAALLLLRLPSTVYSRARALTWAGDRFGEPDLDDAYPVTYEERFRVAENVAGIFGEHRVYWLQLDPVFPRDGSETPVAGDLGDDFGNICRDILPALRACESGSDRFDDIIFEWRATTPKRTGGPRGTRSSCSSPDCLRLRLGHRGMEFSELFNVPADDDTERIDPILTVDTRLFIDNTDNTSTNTLRWSSSGWRTPAARRRCCSVMPSTRPSICHAEYATVDLSCRVRDETSDAAPRRGRCSCG